MVALSASSQHIAAARPLLQQRRPAQAARRASAVPVRAVAAPDAATRASPVILNGQILHSATQEQLDVVKGMDKFAEEQVRRLQAGWADALFDDRGPSTNRLEGSGGHLWQGTCCASQTGCTWRETESCTGCCSHVLPTCSATTPWSRCCPS